MNIYLILYGLVALAIVLGGSKKLYDMGMTIATVMFAVGSVFLLVTFGLRWFASDKSIFSDATVKWPPVINTCPDYLTYYKRTKADGTKEDTCIDTIGVSLRGQQQLAIFPDSESKATDDKYFFSLKTSSTDPTIRNKELCSRAVLYGLTWEGITNGESCISQDGTTQSTSPNSGSGCPA